jgi:energy-coupling factor transporter ATP-binding protein EcfA2
MASSIKEKLTSVSNQAQRERSAQLGGTSGISVTCSAPGFGIDSSQIVQNLPSFNEEAHAIEANLTNQSMLIDITSVRRTDVEDILENRPEVPKIQHRPEVRPSTEELDHFYNINSQGFQQKMYILKYMIDGSTSDNVPGLSIYLTESTEETILMKTLMPPEKVAYALTDSGHIDWSSISPRVLDDHTARQDLSSDNPVSYVTSDPLQFIEHEHVSVLRIFFEAQKLISLLQYYEYETDTLGLLFTRWQRAFYVAQSCFEYARSRLMFQRARHSTVDFSKIPKAIQVHLEHYSFHIGQTKAALMKQLRDGKGDLRNAVAAVRSQIVYHDLRRSEDGEILYRQRYTADGTPTFTWYPFIGLRQFIIDVTDKDDELRTWKQSNKHAIDQIFGVFVPYRNGNAPAPYVDDLPIVRANRYIFAYKNGVYDVYENKFHFDAHSLPEDKRTACRYFDKEFDPAWLGEDFDWRSINTPLTEQIFEFQGFKEAGRRATEDMIKPADNGPQWAVKKKSDDDTVKKLSPSQQAVYNKLKRNGKDPQDLIDWIYGLLGRYLFDVNKLDRWQIALFLLGRAGTGKSTIAQILAGLYPRERVKTMANQFETVFGLETMTTSFINIALDINSQFSMDMCDFKSIVSGESISVRQKGKAAQSNVIIPGPMLLVGNLFPSWPDEEGSISRRLALLRFPKKVGKEQVDTTLLNKIINDELPLLLVKMRLAYGEKVVQVGTDAVDRHWSYYFDKSVAELGKENSVFESFFASQAVVLMDKKRDEQAWYNTYIPDEKLKQAFNSYCSANLPKGTPTPKWDPNYVSSVICEGRDVTRFESVTLPWPRKTTVVDWKAMDSANQGTVKKVYWRGIDLAKEMPSPPAVNGFATASRQ